MREEQAGAGCPRFVQLWGSESLPERGSVPSLTSATPQPAPREPALRALETHPQAQNREDLLQERGNPSLLHL